VLTPVSTWQTVGALGAGALFFICLTLILTKLKSLSLVIKLPLITLLILSAMLFAHFDLNDNHKVRAISPRPHVAGAANSIASGLYANEAFAQWLAQRRDRHRFAAPRKYPVYIVAVQGGGIYAAYHAATFLSSLQDLCPAFAHHLFAVSGVSGGSVGAAIFAALVSQFSDSKSADTSDSACLSDAERTDQNRSIGFYVGTSDEILKQDFLAPLVAAALFPDFLQRFLFRPIPEFDRAVSLERALEDALERERTSKNATDWKGKQNILSLPFLDHWSPASNSPALLINTTEVGSGRRRIISPFRFMRNDILIFPLWNKKSQAPHLPARSNEDQAQSITLSTAVMLSARFPWITPAGWFYDESLDGSDAEAGGENEGRRVKTRLVDGGYFENSGVVTALDLLNEIELRLAADGLSSQVEANIIVLTTSGYPKQSYYGFGDWADPIRALLNTRAARSEIAIGEAEHLLNGDRDRPDKAPQAADNEQPTPERLRKVQLRDMGYPLPLGWRLSDLTRMLIFAQNGVPSECVPDRRYLQTKPGRFDADCVAEVVRRELQ